MICDIFGVVHCDYSLVSFLCNNLILTQRYHKGIFLFKFSGVQFHYRMSYKKSTFVLLEKSIQGNSCDIMEGGQEAFNLRKQKYNIR